jgi:hypothetical protein
MHIFNEYQNCQESFQYFCEKYVKFPTDIGLNHFKPFDYQNELIDFIEENRFVIYKKFRKGGFTTLTLIYSLWKCLFFEEQSIFIAFKTRGEAEHASKYLSNIIHEFPHFLKILLINNTIHYKAFATNSKLVLSNFEAGRGHKLTHLFIEEAAYMSNARNTWKAFFPCVSQGGKVVISSTPHGTDNWFYELYSDSERQANSFLIYKTDYKKHPFYNNELVVNALKETLGEVGFRQDICGEFIDVGHVITSKLIKKDLTPEEVLDELENLLHNKSLKFSEKMAINEAINLISRSQQSA